MWKADTDNQTLTRQVPQWRENRKKHNIQNDAKTLLGKYENIMHKELFEEI